MLRIATQTTDEMISDFRTTRPAAATMMRLLAGVVLGIGASHSPLAAQRPERFTEWTAPVFPVAEYVARRAVLMGQLSDRDVLLVPGAEGTSGGETFRQLDDFEYFVGLEVPRSLLVVDGHSHRSILFVPKSDPRFENGGRPNDFPGRSLASDPSLRALSGVDAVPPDDGSRSTCSPSINAAPGC